jgi:murein tripeptide amidase MpaA
MSFISSQPLRPLLILIILIVAVIGIAVLRPDAEPLSLTTVETPTRAIIQRAVATAAPVTTPASPIPTPTETPVFVKVIDPTAEGLPEESTQSLTPQAASSPTPERIQEHTVQPGESVDSIALLYNTTAASIAALNFLAEPDLLYPDQTLLVPLYPKPPLASEALEPTIIAALENAGSEPAVLGYSVLDRPIELYTFGSGPNTLIFVGGLHGGYEWNSTVLAYEVIDYFTEAPTAVPESITVHIIPAANPDGIFAVTGKSGPISATNVIISDTFPARFNANGVDLNRNWGCDWTASAVWWDEIVSGGTAPYSEVENQILLAFIQSQEATLRGVIFWHSSAFLVSPGQCGGTVHQPSQDIANAYALAARYPVGSFNAYPVTGEASDSLAQMGIPSFSVELSSHESIDWIRNRDGIQALFAYLTDD